MSKVIKRRKLTVSYFYSPLVRILFLSSLDEIKFHLTHKHTNIIYILDKNQNIYNMSNNTGKDNVNEN
jgi:hypothetical protein